MYNQGTTALDPKWFPLVSSPVEPKVAVKLLDEATQSLDHAVKGLHEQISELRGFNASVLGNIPPADPTNKAAEFEEGTRADALRQRLVYLHAAIADLRREVNRLSAI